MSAPNPNDFKNVIPGATSGLCEKLRNLLVTLPQLVTNWVAFEFTDAGTFSADYQALICASCTGGATPGTGGTNPQNPNMPAPAGVNATDGTYSDRVEVTWNAVTPPSGFTVTQYKIYRAPQNIVNPNQAGAPIAFIASPALIYEDVGAVNGTIYNYWVVATDGDVGSNGVTVSAFSSPLERGNAGAPTTTIPAVSDLRATRGFSAIGGGVIGLVWTPPTGATKYDIYRNTINDSSTATKIETDAVPTLASSTFSNATPPIYDNDGEILYQAVPPNANTQYYFWVIAKKDAPPAVSTFSNSALGWDSVLSGIYLLSSTSLGRGASTTVPGGATKMYVVLFGGGGGGAGGGSVFGGGGGGGPGVVVDTYTVSPGDTLDVSASPNVDQTGNAATGVNGDDGSTVTFKINTVSKMVANAGLGGVYNPAGGGAGGAGGSASGTTAPTIYAGKAGGAASGALGGASGYYFGSRRFPPAHFNGFAAFTSWTGDAVGPASPGGGSYPNASAPSVAVGGFGETGYAVIGFGA